MEAYKGVIEGYVFTRVVAQKARGEDKLVLAINEKERARMLRAKQNHRKPSHINNQNHSRISGT